MLHMGNNLTISSILQYIQIAIFLILSSSSHQDLILFLIDFQNSVNISELN